MYHSDPNNYGRTAAPEAYVPGRTPQQQAAHEQANSQALDALSSLLWTIWLGVPIALAGKAGFNWNELTGDKGASVERAAQALVRWKWLQIGAIWTLIVLAFAWTKMPPLLTTLWVTPVWCVFFWLVMYVRIAEFSLFRRGPLQWVMTPAVRILDGVHSWAIIVAAVLPVPAAILLTFTPSVPTV